MTINIKEAQHPLKREKQVIDKSSIMLKILTKSMHYFNQEFNGYLADDKKMVSLEDRKALSVYEESASVVSHHYQVAIPWRNQKALFSKQSCYWRQEIMQRRSLVNKLTVNLVWYRIYPITVSLTPRNQIK